MTDATREEAQAELRQVISDAYSSKTLWTTDWAGVQLKRCSCSGLYLPTLITFPFTSLLCQFITQAFARHE